ncbi:MAG TPA: hypothetical protein VGQ58_04205 [Candidatus Limnocylindrales bacterium]|jgi:hypothetical protein|nr:hypothetical protein [Candidatus Limnocylindrales bacterium]
MAELQPAPRPGRARLTPDDIRAGKGPRRETDTYVVEFGRDALAAFLEIAWKAARPQGGRQGANNIFADANWLRRILTFDAFDTGEGTVELVVHSREDWPDA